MTRSNRHTYLPACALAALLMLGACGGGDDPAPQAAAQTITFAAPANQTFGAAPVALVASASSGLAVSLASTTAGVCTVTGTTLTLVGAGTCSVTASQAGNASFLAATPVSNSITVAPTPQTITFASPGNQTLGTAPPALAATSSSSLAVTFTSTTTGVCTVSGTALTLLTVGDCTINASQAGTANIAAAPGVSRTFTVSAAPLTAQTITFASPGNQTLGTVPPALVATASSGLPVTLTSTTTGICTVSGTSLALLAAGSCTVNASQAGNSAFSAAPLVSRSFTVAAIVSTGNNAFANGGFEVAANGAGEFADGWQTLNGVVRSSAQARTGSFSALFTITDGQPAGRGLFQNSIDHGMLIPVPASNVGTSPTLTFWWRGNPSETGNFNYALRYLSSGGAILNAGAQSRTIATGNSERGWTQVTLSGIVIPANTAAAFIEMTLAAGPSGSFPGCGGTCDGGIPAIYVDDVDLQLLP